MSKAGLWINDKTFVNFAETKAKSLTEEIATRHRSSQGFYALANIYLPNPDPVLRKQGKGLDVYRELLVDDRVRGNWGNRKGATLALEWEVDRGQKGKNKSRQAKVIEEWLKSLDLERIAGEILDARLYGYQPLELLWAKSSAGLLPRDIVGKPPEWFVYDNNNTLRFLTRNSPLLGEELPPRSFVCPTSESSYVNPYGLGLLASCFWPVVFKKGGWKFWVSFAERYGQAFAVGKIRRGATKPEMDDLADKLESMVQDAIAVIYDDSSVELMNVEGKGVTTDLFQGLIAEANTAISGVIMGHAGGGQSTPGKLGGEQLAQDVRGDLRDGDKKLVCQTMNQIIRHVGELNWNSAEGLPTFGLWEEEDVDQEQAERDDKLSGSLEKSGLKLTRSYYQRTYNLEEGDLVEQPVPEPAKEAPPAAPAVEFSETLPEVSPLERAAERLATGADAPMTAWVEMLRTLTDNAASLEELRDSILAAYPEMSLEALAQVMAEELTRSAMAGRLDVEAGQ